MKNIALLMSILLVSNCFAGRRKITKIPKLPKTIQKVLVERITKKGRILTLVDSQVAHVGTTQPPLELTAHRRTIDWARLQESITSPGRLAGIEDSEVIFTGNKPRQIE